MDSLYNQLIINIQNEPTPSQSAAIIALAEFVAHASPHSALLLKGYAGTGKTTLIAALVKALHQMRISFEIMAPTGRAAKVVANQANCPANTIHRTIYSVSQSNGANSFKRRKNTQPKRLYIVDESSMIAAGGLGAGFSEQDSLLDDLSDYIHEGVDSLVLFVGDTAQLPPVQETLSRALDPFYLEHLFCSVQEVEMDDVVRQAQQSGILHYATQIRRQIEEHDFRLPSFQKGAYPDVKILAHEEVLETIEQERSRCGAKEVAIICRSNKRAIAHNAMVRRYLLQYDDQLVAGDRVIICRNSYYWTQSEPAIPFIANGDQALLHRVYNFHTRYGMQFAEVEFSLEDYPEAPEVNALVMLDVLQSPTPSLSPSASKSLYQAVYTDLMAERGKAPTKTMLRNNRYLNALQIKYGYAATCHKAQGGQWASVFIDFEIYNPDEACTMDQLRWIYTAFTRATERVYLIAPPKEMIANCETDY